MPQSLRRRRRSRRALVMLAPTVMLALSACVASPAEVPGDATLHSTSTTPGSSGTATDDVGSIDSAAVSRFITNCLARYGLGERPTLPADANAAATAAAQRLRDQYDATFTDCTAAALATAAPTPAAPTTDAAAETATPSPSGSPRPSPSS
ncbi:MULTISPECIES: hypothetical protein [unclassified Rathayibacter]|uniref:hypothetical protein n=1 Tax=unclassified Rathayibacter TaxID=2609250 RepID=UPI00188B6A08|nr:MULTISPECIES: hypothetical protein [unclassified Rathayibacter]MBF4462850.1 hypothetical protein [Rathayibacter sp. VKM Ac-2879]MBF4504264.1 hypothetical protein [Rathayibacter sp. VKM Ac-2878]